MSPESTHFEAAKLEYLESTVHHRGALATAFSEEVAARPARGNACGRGCIVMCSRHPPPATSPGGGLPPQLGHELCQSRRQIFR
jgi:hypothetical protein